MRSGNTPTLCCATPCARAAFNRSRPYKAGAVGLALWFFIGVHRSRTIKLTGEIVGFRHATGRRCTRRWKATG